MVVLKKICKVLLFSVEQIGYEVAEDLLLCLKMEVKWTDLETTVILLTAIEMVVASGWEKSVPLQIIDNLYLTILPTK